MVMCMMCIDDVREAEHQMKMNDIHLKTKRLILILYDIRDIISFYQMFKCDVNVLSVRARYNTRTIVVGLHVADEGLDGAGYSSDGWP